MMKREDAEALLEQYSSALKEGTRLITISKNVSWTESHRFEKDGKAKLNEAEQIRLHLLIELLS